MKKSLILLFLIIFSLKTFAQIKFEKGYFIDNTDKKTECLIRDVGWRNNPISFRYKLSADGSSKIQTIETIKAFEIYNKTKYIRCKVDIDRTSSITDRLRSGREPKFKEEVLFLNVLIEGKASLYLYKDEHLIRFFFKKDDLEMKQLNYKEYLVEGDKIAKNNDFRMQLYDNLKCTVFNLQSFKNLNYNQGALEKIFKNYNVCENSEFRSFKKDKAKFGVNLRLHINQASLRAETSSFNFRDSDFGNQTYLGLGVELERTLPFNKEKWSIIAEPTFKMFNSEIEKDVSTVQGGKVISKIDYKFIEIPVGFRHYMFLNNKSKLFIDATYIFNLSVNSTIRFERASGDEFNTLDMVKSVNYGFGVGYQYNDKYSVELRHLTTRGLLDSNSQWRSDIMSTSLIIGYKLF